MLFDLLQADQQIVPWCLTLHYRGIPDDLILRTGGIESIRYFFINSLKEAMYLRTNSSKEVMNMAKETENKLIESIISSTFVPRARSGLQGLLVHQLQTHRRCQR